MLLPRKGTARTVYGLVAVGGLFCASVALAGNALVDDFGDGDLSDWSQSPTSTRVSSPSAPTIVDGELVHDPGGNANQWIVKDHVMTADGGLTVKMGLPAGADPFVQVHLLTADFDDGEDIQGYRVIYFGGQQFQVRDGSSTIYADFGGNGDALDPDIETHEFLITRDQDGHWRAKLNGSELAPNQFNIESPINHTEFTRVGVWIRTGETLHDLVVQGTPAGASAATEHLQASVPGIDDEFGKALDVWETTAVVGSPSCDGSAGFVTVFDCTGGNWTETAVVANPGDPTNGFGASVAIWGSLLAVGAPHDSTEANESGLVYLFRNVAGTWTPVGTVGLDATGVHADEEAHFGASLDLERNWLAVGAPDFAFNQGGVACVFDVTDPSNPIESISSVSGGGSRHGTAVALEGDRLAISAPGVDEGAVFVLRFDGAAWGNDALISPLGATGGVTGSFGASIALRDGNLYVGSPGDDAAGTNSGAVFFYPALQNSDEQVLVPSTLSAGDRFGSSISCDDGVLVASAPHDDPAGTRSGSAYVYSFVGDTLYQRAQLTSPDGAAYDLFGAAVAVQDGRAAIGAPVDCADVGSVYVFEDFGDAPKRAVFPRDGSDVVVPGERTFASDGDLGAVLVQDSGGTEHVDVYQRTSGEWIQRLRLTADGTTDLDVSGDRIFLISDASSLPRVFAWDGSFLNSDTVGGGALPGPTSISADGDTFVVGDASDNAADGSVTIYTRSGTHWSVQQTIDGASGQDDEFGTSVSLDGDSLIVGAPDLTASDSPGSASVYLRSGGTWSLDQSFSPASLTGLTDTGFGRRVRLDDELALGSTDGGSVFVYRDGSDPTDWAEEDEIPTNGASDFGTELDLAGGLAAISTGDRSVQHWESKNGIWELQGTFEPLPEDSNPFGDGIHVGEGLGEFDFEIGVWAFDKVCLFDQDLIDPTPGVGELDELDSTHVAAGDVFGFSSDLGGDVGVVGAPEGTGDGVANAGTVCVYDGSTGVFLAAGELAAASPVAGDEFGYSVATDGIRIIVGAPGTNGDEGSVTVFAHDGNDWVIEATLVADAVDPGDRFGAAVDIDGTRLIVGAPEHAANGYQSGAAFLYEFDGEEWVFAERELPYNARNGDHFGAAVSIDGSSAIIGAPDKEFYGDRSGTAYLVSSTSGWYHFATFKAQTTQDFDRFGAAVAIDGNTIVIGAPGSNRVEAFTGSLSNWASQGTLTRSGGGGGDLFGSAVCLDGSTTLVGAPGADLLVEFVRSAGTWSEDRSFQPFDLEGGEEFGVAVGCDDDSALVTSLRGANSGRAFAIELQPSAPPIAPAYLAPSHVAAVVPGPAAKRKSRRDATPGLKARGTLDLGVNDIDFTRPGQLLVGDRVYSLESGLVAKGKRRFVYADDEVRFEVRLRKNGTSKARFKLRIRDDLSGALDPDGDLELSFRNGQMQAQGTVALRGGKLADRRNPALSDPGLVPVQAKIKLREDYLDRFDFTLRFDPAQYVADAGVELWFGDDWYAYVPQHELEGARGSRLRYRSKSGAGLSKVVIDLEKGEIHVSAKDLPLADLHSDSDEPILRFGVGFGGHDTRCQVRAVRKGDVIRY